MATQEPEQAVAPTTQPEHGLTPMLVKKTVGAGLAPARLEPTGAIECGQRRCSDKDDGRINPSRKQL